MARATLAAFLLTMWLSGQAAPPEAPSPAPCTCATAKLENGWCEAHGRGYVASIEIRSKLVYETLDAHGHTLDLSTFQCAACQKAIASDGFCEDHRVGFVNRQVYFSRLTYELARGQTRDPATLTCPVCRKNAESRGWCEKCGLGMVGRVAMKDRQGYEHAARAAEILQAATQAAQRCEWCAVAMITDTQCPLCKIIYKDGKPLASTDRR